MASSSDLEDPISSAAIPYSYSPLPDGEQRATDEPVIRHPKKPGFFLVSAFLAVAFLVALIAGNGPQLPNDSNIAVFPTPQKVTPLSLGVDKGVSDKTFHHMLGAENSYPWSPNMLDWQRTGFHFQPQKN